MKQGIQQLTQGELFKLISDVCEVVNKVTNSEELLEASLAELLHLFDADRGSVFILDEQTQHLVMRASKGLKSVERQQLVKKMGEGVVGLVAQTKKPIFVEDITRDSRFRHFQARNSYQTSSFICAPLLLKDKLIGIINIADKSSGQVFSIEELHLLDFLSSQIALNYRRIELYKKMRHVLRESQDLKDELGKTSQETSRLKRQMIVHEKLATLGKLAGGIAHEFNNPLDGVTRYTNLCLQHVGEDEVMRGYLLEIKQGLNRMANVVRSLLACSRGETRNSTQQIDFNKAVVQVIDSMKMDITKKDINVERYLKPDLPLIFDLGFDRVVENLLRNAIDAVEEGGRIAISTDFLDGSLVLTVEDDGCGIDDSEDFYKIFEPFYTTKESEKGCGLGLTIVSEIIKSYDGSIRVESALGKGTKFVATFPIREDRRNEQW
ncbi:MAG: ATP-binding protein [Candidatus Omnitrophota bacterium]